MIDSISELPTPPEYNRSFIEKLRALNILGRHDKKIWSDPSFTNALPLISKTFDDSWVWHGTGRYQYDPKNRGQTRDVLQTIISENGLIPHTDVLDFTRGKMESISTSSARLYSLMYAQCHYERGKTLLNYGRNVLIWVYYLRPMVWRGLVEAFVHKDPAYVKMLDRETRVAFGKAAGGFHDKYSKTRMKPIDMPKGGLSDIVGNYPILIGIKKGSFEKTNIARLIDKHELRSETPIILDNFTHIEVPEERVSEVSRLLHTAGKTVPVYPLEWGIEYSKDLPLSLILDGKK